MSDDNNTEYVCALTGIAAREEDLVDDAGDGDELDELPVGWTQVTFSRRILNPEWVAVQTVMAASVDQLMSQVPAESKEAVEGHVTIVVRAQFASLLAQTPKYITDTEELFLGIPHGKEVVQAHNDLRTLLGMDQISSEDNKA